MRSPWGSPSCSGTVPAGGFRDGGIRVGAAAQILFLEETVGADIALGIAVRAAVVGNDIEPALGETLDDAFSACPVVGNTVQVDQRATTVTGRSASPALQRHAIAHECGILTRSRAWSRHHAAHRVQQPVSAEFGQLLRDHPENSGRDGSKSEENQPCP